MTDETRTIYLDHNATTPVSAEAGAAMEPFFGEDGWGNPSSGYGLGKKAKQGLSEARDKVARALGASPGEIIFTSGGTESNNWVFKGLAHTLKNKGNHFVTTNIEHPAITNPALYLMEYGFDTTFAAVDKNGVADVAAIEKAITDKTILVSVMLANNETGAIQPIAEIAALARARGVLMHTDAAQAVGKIPMDVNELGVDFLSVAGHKVYAPKGVGALYIREGVSMEPFMHGGGQEGGRRAGTENAAYAAALGAAMEAAKARMPEEAPRVAALRDRLAEKLLAAFPDAVVNGGEAPRLPNTLSISFPGVWGQEILDRAPGISASTGAACHGGHETISHVLSAMAVPREIAMGTVRLSLGRGTTEEQVDEAAERIIAARKSMG